MASLDMARQGRAFDGADRGRDGRKKQRSDGAVADTIKRKKKHSRNALVDNC